MKFKLLKPKENSEEVLFGLDESEVDGDIILYSIHNGKKVPLLVIQNSTRSIFRCMVPKGSWMTFDKNQRINDNTY